MMPNQPHQSSNTHAAPQLTPPPNTNHPTRLTKQPTYLLDYHCYLAQSSPSSPASTNSVMYPISTFLTNKKLSPSFRTFVLAITSQTEPQFFSQAVQFQVWRDAMADELRALASNKTWSICSLPLGKHPIGCKWVYKIKFKADGTVERHKAWLVAKGFTQQ